MNQILTFFMSSMPPSTPPKNEPPELDLNEVAPFLASKEHQETLKIYEHPLVQSHIMEIRHTVHIRSLENPYVNSRYFIGSLQDSPHLYVALKLQKLDPFLRELDALYRDVYAKAPWKEYLICPCCRTKTGIESIDPFVKERYGQVANFEKETGFKAAELHCQPCSAQGIPTPLQFFYIPGETADKMKELLNENVSASFTFAENNNLVGFCIGFECQVKDGWKDKVIEGFGDKGEEGLTWEEYFSEIQNAFQGTVLEGHITPETPALNFAEWGIDERLRSSKLGLENVKTMLETASKTIPFTNGDIPVLGTSIKDSKFLNIARSLQCGVEGSMLPGGKIRFYATLSKVLEKIDKILAKRS